MIGPAQTDKELSPTRGPAPHQRRAYDLFSAPGVRAVGIDEVINNADVAKAILYRHFTSKDALVLAFLRRREERWTYEWLAADVTRRASTPKRNSS